MRVTEVRSDLDFTKEPIGAECRGEFGAEDFDSDLPLVFQILGEINNYHAATAEFPLDGVAGGEGGFEVIQVSHGAGSGWM
jgi:hypothetical protein